jgi:hypothetical protein
LDSKVFENALGCEKSVFRGGGITERARLYRSRRLMRGAPADAETWPEAYQGGNVRLIFIRFAFLKNRCTLTVNLRLSARSGKRLDSPQRVTEEFQTHDFKFEIV